MVTCGWMALRCAAWLRLRARGSPSHCTPTTPARAAFCCLHAQMVSIKAHVSHASHATRTCLFRIRTALLPALSLPRRASSRISRMLRSAVSLPPRCAVRHLLPTTSCNIFLPLHAPGKTCGALTAARRNTRSHRLVSSGTDIGGYGTDSMIRLRCYRGTASPPPCHYRLCLYSHLHLLTACLPTPLPPAAFLLTCHCLYRHSPLRASFVYHPLTAAPLLHATHHHVPPCALPAASISTTTVHTPLHCL